MSTVTLTKPRRDSLNLRIPAAERSLIDRAAESAGKTRTDVILQAARRAAEETFLARLDQPAQPSDSLRRTMQAKAPWKAA